MRSEWNDADATFVGFKGGTNKAHHGHLDLGTFVLDSAGQRWAIDLGSDDYGSPDYFNGEKRWGYYRASTAGHNTLVIDGRNQDPAVDAEVIKFFSTDAGRTR